MFLCDLTLFLTYKLKIDLKTCIFENLEEFSKTVSLRSRSKRLSLLVHIINKLYKGIKYAEYFNVNYCG